MSTPRENGGDPADEPRASHRARLEMGQAKIEGKVDNLRQTLETFIRESSRRHEQAEKDIDHVKEQNAVQLTAIKDKLSDSGKTNWPALGVLLTAIGGLAVLYIAPLKTAQESADHRLEAQTVTFADNMRRIEEDRRRDQADLDIRLQREMRLLTETVNTKFDAGKEMMLGRLQIDEKRTDDVTTRVDDWNTDERRELHGFWSAAAKKATQP